MKRVLKKKVVAVSVFFILSLLSITGVTGSFQRKVILPPAENYVEESQEKALAAFAAISIVKGLVAVVEGSDVVGIEVGDIVQPLYDAVDITWKLITASLATLYVLEAVLRICGLVGAAFMAAVFSLLGVLQFTEKDYVKRLAFTAGVLAFSFYIAIPASLFLSGKLSDSYSSDIRAEYDLRMSEFEERFSARLEEVQSARILDIEGWPPVVAGSFPNFRIDWPDLDSVKLPQLQIIAGIVTDMKDLTDVLPELLLRTGVTWILDVMIIPLGMLFILYKLALLLTDSMLGSARADKFERAVKNTIEAHMKTQERR
jgi:hypothetical protein